MFCYKEKILSPGQLKRLGEHKYKYDSVSLMDPFLQPFWNWLVSKIPLWLAPNLITVLGLIVNIVTTLILVWYSPDAKSEAPRWAFFLCAVGLFAYQSLDAIDGKQARRTNSSTPLGELFDHGCDSISTVFVTISACIAVQLGYSPSWMFFQCFCAVTLFYCAHWQTYVSGTLRFGKVDVTEAQFTIIFIHLVSAIFGPNIWSTKIPGVEVLPLRFTVVVTTIICGSVSLFSIFTVVFTGGVGKNGSTVAVSFCEDFQYKHGISSLFFAGFSQVFLHYCHWFAVGGAGKNGSTVALPWANVELKLTPVFVGIFVAIYLVQNNMAVIFTGGIGKNGSSVAINLSGLTSYKCLVALVQTVSWCGVLVQKLSYKQSGLTGLTSAGTSVLSPVIPLSLVIIPACIICLKSVQNVYENHPVLYIMAFGLATAKVANRLVVAHMTKNEMEYFDPVLIGPVMLFLNQYFNFYIDEYYVLCMCTLWVVIDLLRYSSLVCKEICDYLHIDLFHIPLVESAITQPNKNATHKYMTEPAIIGVDEADKEPLLQEDDESSTLSSRWLDSASDGRRLASLYQRTPDSSTDSLITLKTGE